MKDDDIVIFSMHQFSFILSSLFCYLVDDVTRGNVFKKIVEQNTRSTSISLSIPICLHQFGPNKKVIIPDEVGRSSLSSKQIKLL